MKNYSDDVWWHKWLNNSNKASSVIHAENVRVKSPLLASLICRGVNRWMKSMLLVIQPLTWHREIFVWPHPIISRISCNAWSCSSLLGLYLTLGSCTLYMVLMEGGKLSNIERLLNLLVLFLQQRHWFLPFHWQRIETRRGNVLPKAITSKTWTPIFQNQCHSFDQVQQMRW